MAAKYGYIGNNPADSSVFVARQTFSPSGITTTFTFASGYTIGYLDAYLNGSRLIEGQDYVATNGSTIDLVSSATGGDVLELLAYKAFNTVALTHAPGNFEVAGDFTVQGNSFLAVSNGIGTVTIGIGSTALFVDGNARIVGILTIGSSSITLNGSTNTINVGAGLTFDGNTGIVRASEVYADGVNLANAVRVATPTSVTISSAAADEEDYTAVTINSSGINVVGVITATTVNATNFNSTSDQKLKTNIQTVENALDITEKLRGVSFDWKENETKSYGVIAQELEEILPELVKNGEVKSVNYNGLIGVLIEAIKELKKEVEKFKVAK